MPTAQAIEETGEQPVRVHGERIRTSGALGRSSLQLRLFDFLLEASLEGRAPKEAEIAQRVFGAAGFDGAVDGSVRVAVHRLRRKLEEYHAAAGTTGEGRLVIPRGSYRLELVSDPGEDAEPPAGDPEPAEAGVDQPGAPPSRHAPLRRLAQPLLIAALVLLAVAGGGYALLAPARSAAGQAANSAFWSPLTGSSRRTFIVVGDFYIFGEVGDDGHVRRLVREFAINSRSDLDTFLMYNPDQVDRYRDLNLSYLPTGTANALRAVVPIVDAAVQSGAPRPRVISMSELTPEILRDSNIVYVGYLSSLGLLRNPLFAASRFEVGASYDELVDERTRTRYLADVPSGDRPTTNRGYGYLATLPGPTGNRIIVVAGTRDAALAQAAEIARDAERVEKVMPSGKVAGAFEALYTVSAFGNLNVEGRAAVASPMSTDGLWKDSSEERHSFPDEMTPLER